MRVKFKGKKKLRKIYRTSKETDQGKRCLKIPVRRYKYNIKNGNTIQKNLRAVAVRKCLLFFSAESFVFQVAIQKFKDQDI